MLEITNQIDAATYIAIGIFILGFVIAGIINQAKKQVELKLYKQLIVSWTESTKENFDSFISRLTTFAQAVSKNESLIYRKI